MNITLNFGDIIFCFSFERRIEIDEEFLPFIEERERSDVHIFFSWNWVNVQKKPKTMDGKDIFQNFYHDDEYYYCETRAGAKGLIASLTCNKDYSHAVCYINEISFISPPRRLRGILRFLPMKSIMLYYNVLFMHASQVSINEIGIVFAAPSGVGKTTQAKLWAKYKSAKLLCNDRTLIRKIDHNWKTYGYPIDGSDPVCSGERKKLGCIVMLKQNVINQVVRLKPAKAVTLLMGQLVIDEWKMEARTKAIDLLLNLVSEIPVYQLECTPDFRSVDCLAEKLIKDGVLKGVTYE